MSHFLENLISRHTDIGSNVKSDLMGRFEAPPAPPAFPGHDGAAGTGSGSDFPDWEQDTLRTGIVPRMPSAGLRWPFDPRVSSKKADDAVFEKTDQIDEPTRSAPFHYFRKQEEPDTPKNVGSAGEESRVSRQGELVSSSPLPAELTSLRRPGEEPDAPENVASAEGEKRIPDPQRTDPPTDFAGLLTKPANIPGLIKLTDNRKMEEGSATATPIIPTVKVTIGRLDVRAITPPTPAPVQAKSGPKPLLSLEDYLKQREARQ